MVSNDPQIPVIVDLYAMISIMRVVSLPQTLASAEKVMHATTQAYFEPNRTVRELHDRVMNGNAVDPLREFSVGGPMNCGFSSHAEVAFRRSVDGLDRLGSATRNRPSAAGSSPVPEDTAPSRSARSAAPTAAVAIVAILLVTMIALSIWYSTRREPLVVQGEVQSRTFDMAARVDGRVAKVEVDRSANVKQGAPLIRIDNPELIARYAQSEADLAVAEAELARVQAGFRAETIAVRKAQTERAEADVTLAQQTYDRKRTLAASHERPSPTSTER